MLARQICQTSKEMQYDTLERKAPAPSMPSHEATGSSVQRLDVQPGLLLIKTQSSAYPLAASNPNCSRRREAVSLGTKNEKHSTLPDKSLRGGGPLHPWMYMLSAETYVAAVCRQPGSLLRRMEGKPDGQDGEEDVMHQ